MKNIFVAMCKLCIYEYLICNECTICLEVIGYNCGILYLLLSIFDLLRMLTILSHDFMS